MRGRPQAARDIDDYLAGVPERQRAPLERLRQTIKAVAPDSIEAISYQVPTFKYQGRPLVGFAATKTGCTFYVMSSTLLQGYATDVEGYQTGKGSLGFSPEKPLPTAIVKRLVKARMAEIDAATPTAG
jgi:uncharacterized protein YdhG (YjbR/CyaY superfamily)